MHRAVAKSFLLLIFYGRPSALPLFTPQGMSKSRPPLLMVTNDELSSKRCRRVLSGRPSLTLRLPPLLSLLSSSPLTLSDSTFSISILSLLFNSLVVHDSMPPDSLNTVLKYVDVKSISCY